MGDQRDRAKVAKDQLRNRFWRCPDCHAVLGIISADLETLRIKKGDMVIHIVGGKVSRVCKSCGAWCTLKNTPSKEIKEGKEVIASGI